jgi:DNA-binding SARP family transcriptional activator
MEALWPEMDPEAAGANLRKAIHFARRALGANELIELSGDAVELAPGHEVVTDVEEFEAAARTALDRPDAAACQRAADLYRGELLPDDRYAGWAEKPREQLRQRYARLLKGGKLWDRALALDPTDEQAQCALMQAALDAGNRGEAIRRFESLRKRLRIDLGVGPSAATVALYERALTSPAVETPSATDRLRASLARGLVELQSGEFARAERIARETRALALGAGLAREVGEASALLGLTAHMQGKWRDLFRSEFVESVRAAPRFIAEIFDGHLCLAEFCLGGANSHADMAVLARELLSVAEGAGSTAGRALATLILGETELFSGRLDEAERLLAEAEGLHANAGADSGRVMAVQRLAEVALARGKKWEAGRMVQRAQGIAEKAWLAPHLVIGLTAVSVRAATTPEKAAETILEGDRALAAGGVCQVCSMSFRTESAIALAEAGELEQVGRRLDEAERLAGMWNGGPWVAAVWEARGVLRRAQGNEERAAALLGEAAARFAELGRPLDQARCLARKSARTS